MPLSRNSRVAATKRPQVASSWSPKWVQMGAHATRTSKRGRAWGACERFADHATTAAACLALAACLLLSQVSSVISSTSPAPAQAAAAAAAQSSGTNNYSSSLPGISERAAGGGGGGASNGLNSRYLSAGSTASLAAATVAAANQQQQQQAQVQVQAPQANVNNQHQGAQQHHHQHQAQQQQHSPALALQQQQQQQQQQQPSSASQYNTVVAGQTQQQPLSALANGNPPVMAATHAYNPLAGQFLQNFEQQQQQQQPFVAAQTPQLPPTAGPQFQAQVPSQGQQYNSVFGGGGGQFSAVPQQQQSSFGFPYQSFSPARQAQLYQRPFGFPFGHFAASPSQAATYGTGQQQQRVYGSAFSRRNGLAGLRQPQNVGLVGLNDEELLTQQQQQQQQAAAASLADQLAASLGFGGSLDSTGGTPGVTSGGGGLPSPSNAYLVQQQNGQQLLELAQYPQAAGAAGNSLTQQVAPQIYGGQHTVGDYSATTRAEQCVAADGRHGTCYQASECIRRGGTPMGRCNGGGGPSSGADLAQSLSGSSSVCCLFDVTCGQFAAERFVYFRNPGYPSSTYDQARMCRAKIGKLDKGVCQLRLDMLRFDIAKPSNGGNCSQDMFVVSGQNENSVVPKICGFNDGQHYYVAVDESGVITLHMMLMGYYRRSFEILVTQIPCRSDYAAPAHCLQHFMGTHGTIKSFNYYNDYPEQLQDYQLANQQQQQQQQQQQAGASFVNYDLLQLDGAQQTAPYGLQFHHQQQQRQQALQQALQQAPLFAGSGAVQLQQQQQQLGTASGNRYGANYATEQQLSVGGYPNDLDYTICVRKESGFCSISYQLSRGDQGPAPFAVGHFGGAGGAFSHNESSQQNFGGWQPGAVSTECRDDYLLIGGVRLCSGSPAAPAGSGQQVGTFGFEPYGNGSAGVFGGSNNQQQQLAWQLQNQRDQIVQQLGRLQQAALAQQPGNGSALSNGINTQQQQGGNLNNGIINLEQQQAILAQQLMSVQQQLSSLSGSSGGGGNFATPNRYHPADNLQLANDLQSSSIITDTTSGPFLLRFVSNNARNARGFHIDYRQNPCK